MTKLESEASAAGKQGRSTGGPFPTGPKLEVPEGMSKRAYKRQLKQERIEKERPAFIEQRRAKRKELRAKKRLHPADTSKAPKRPRQLPSPGHSTFVIDCGFDELMKDGERTSLARQIVRSYSENRRSVHPVNLEICGFDKKLRQIFDQNMHAQWESWQGITFTESSFIPKDPAKTVYLSSDSETVIESLSDEYTYIIGGIVDKGRYKNLCKDKAEYMGLTTARLPIDEHIQLSGRRVLTTNHVVELMLKWFELRDWKQAFEAALPSRKLTPAAANSCQTAQSTVVSRGSLSDP